MVERAARKNVLDSLRPSEKDVLVLLAQGFSNTEIVRNLSLTKKGVQNKIHAIFSCLDIPNTDTAFNSRVQASLLYLKNVPDFENPFNGFEFKDTLSLGQRDIVIHIGEGCSNREIANRLHFSEGTVEGNISNIISRNLRIDRQVYAPRVVLALISQTSNFLSQNHQ